ncbi:MAG TPA: ubiquinone/menaquinone biosynthesis methyltransferase [Syntrophales bacterium]|nr:ubiquinone/menaquinone biosynthesis methyltransferase [Syntrophales bacterium]HOM06507.1 ubiquinone/menaquinone biosynthesis methyltransferase [Syntrophales bacterium]HON99892.1 ubiquinone/menaquinone biosynthesis methyltransferase [Syntrophales bacterium]HPC01664.1 ubiquinone/menaquinone biosynthesis methyltransferase [Syntrophales bacterium]HPQ06231.1 ubiquinone/menaquinone biosynthesis methyltransferase [Syntrophales bacterium]
MRYDQGTCEHLHPRLRRELVREIFAAIPGRYDLLNRLLSARRDVNWRRFAVERMRFFRTGRLLDLATGTADLAVMAAKRHPRIRVVGVDIAREMMALGRRKVVKRGLSARVTLVPGDAVALPFGEGTFDVAAAAFGIRNIPEVLTALREMTRVVVPGGQVMVLEMHLPEEPLSRGLYLLYTKTALPVIVRGLADNPGAYRYLCDSIASFFSPREFGLLMSEAGLTAVRSHPLTLGLTYLHEGIKPPPPGC